MSMAAMLAPRTFGHNTWTIELYRPRNLALGPPRPSSHQERPMLNLVLPTAALLMAGAAVAAPARSADLPEGAAHNIVLVHGAFVDQTSWKPVAEILTKKGYNVTLVENPLTSLAADV